MAENQIAYPVPRQASSTTTVEGDVSGTLAATIVDKIGGIVASTFFKTLVDDATALIARATLGAMGSTVGSGTTTRAAAASTGTETVAHGLGVAPKIMRFAVADDAGAATYSEGWSVGTAQHTCHRHATGVDALSSSTSINVVVGGAGWTATVSAVDATNITISWTKVGAGLAVSVLWAAFG